MNISGKIWIPTLILWSLLGVFLVWNSAHATSDKKIDICHRTDSATNPYVKINVDKDSADGDTDNDNGQGDHSTHTGEIATSQDKAKSLKDDGQKWGDIIPQHDNYAGLNWTSEGQAIWNNNCNVPEHEPTPPTPPQPPVEPPKPPVTPPKETPPPVVTPEPTPPTPTQVDNCPKKGGCA